MKNDNQKHPRGLISKMELALWYCSNTSPGTAFRRLRRLIHQDPDLMNDLQALHYRKHSHILTPMQVTVIIRHLGEPWE